jgi:hypothetical protein
MLQDQLSATMNFFNQKETETLSKVKLLELELSS